MIYGTSPVCVNLAHWKFDETGMPKIHIPKPTDQALECKNAKCRCKVRHKENESLEDQQIDLNNYEVVPGSKSEIFITPRGAIHIKETVRKKKA